MTQLVGNPFPLFLDRAGRPLTGGKVYIGTAGQDPELNPIAAYHDSAMTIAAEQPINVVGGLMTRAGNPALVFVAADQYSIRVRDADGAEVFYVSATVLPTEQYQPLDDDLTAIAALATTSFGRGLLSVANAAALRTYAGVVDPLPLAGGTMVGDIKRQGAGAYLYITDPAYTSIRLQVTANGAADPRTQVGDIWAELEA